ncbi:RusA family crossover junction endodeoxyribonuclease [Alkalihalobacillus sp. NPDC078783]
MTDKKTLNLTVQGIPPSSNHYLGYRGVRKGNGCMVMAYTKAEAKKFQKEFAKYAKEQVIKQDWDIEDTRYIHHYLDCIFYFDRTDKDSQNYMKVMSDVLNGIAYIDDRTILTRTHEQYYDKNNPRIELSIYPVEYRGIFKNETELDQFEEGCKSCTRYGNNCSILKESKEGRIREEIHREVNGLRCDKYKEKKTNKKG